ncbi:MAG TPA: glycine cleavage system protein GcvH [Candidatus Eremiobacteraceae bacterium]|nr:glycine cleavage system protein GcvH [Candidatus Eremiobacteraceae bacterium]
MPEPSDRQYTKEHEWVRIEGATATIGISQHAQSALGDIVYVELPKPGAVLVKGKPIGVVESVKAVSDIYAPISGTVTAVNGAVEDDPAKVNADPYGDGWLAKITVADAAEAATLLDSKAYDELLKAEGH